MLQLGNTQFQYTENPPHIAKKGLQTPSIFFQKHSGIQPLHTYFLSIFRKAKIPSISQNFYLTSLTPTEINTLYHTLEADRKVFIERLFNSLPKCILHNPFTLYFLYFISTAI